MNQKGFSKIALFVILFVIIYVAIVVVGYFFSKKSKKFVTSTFREEQQQLTQQSNLDLEMSNFKYNEVIKNKIGTSGGVIQNAEKSVIVTIPPLKQETEFTLSFKKSNFEVKSGIGSPITISIYPDINLIESLMDSPTPIKIKVKYDARYNLPVPYLIDEKNKLHLVDIGGLDKENHYFTMYTFHGGDYCWIYATESF